MLMGRREKGLYWPSDHLLLIIVKATLLGLPNISDVQRDDQIVCQTELIRIGFPTKGKS